MLHQQDSVGLVFFEERIRYLVQPSGQPSQLKQMLHLLAVCQPSNVQSQIGTVLNELADRLRKRSMVVVISDCFDDVERILAGMRHLRYKRHEVVLFQILDPAEIDFPFQDTTLFKGLEGLPELMAEPRGLRKAYQRAFNEYLKDLMVACRSVNVDYQLLRTDQPLDLALAGYLAARSSR